MPLPFIVAAGIAAIGVGVGAVANEVRREKKEAREKVKADRVLISRIIREQMSNGEYLTTNDSMQNIVIKLKND